jgi:hypothetical protein
MPAIDALQSAPDKGFEEGAPVGFGLTFIETPSTRRLPPGACAVARTRQQRQPRLDGGALLVRTWSTAMAGSSASFASTVRTWARS